MYTHLHIQIQTVGVLQRIKYYHLHTNMGQECNFSMFYFITRPMILEYNGFLDLVLDTHNYAALSDLLYLVIILTFLALIMTYYMIIWIVVRYRIIKLP